MDLLSHQRSFLRPWFHADLQEGLFLVWFLRAIHRSGIIYWCRSCFSGAHPLLNKQTNPSAYYTLLPPFLFLVFLVRQSCFFRSRALWVIAGLRGIHTLTGFLPMQPNQVPLLYLWFDLCDYVTATVVWRNFRYFFDPLNLGITETAFSRENFLSS